MARFQDLGQQTVPYPGPGLEENKWSCTLTFLGGFKAVVEVNPLDVIGQGCIGQQSPVPVDDVGRKSKGTLLSVHDLGIGAVCILKDSPCERSVRLCMLGKEGALTKLLGSEGFTDKIPPPPMFNNILYNSHTQELC